MWLESVRCTLLMNEIRIKDTNILLKLTEKAYPVQAFTLLKAYYYWGSQNLRGQLPLWLPPPHTHRLRPCSLTYWGISQRYTLINHKLSIKHTLHWGHALIKHETSIQYIHLTLYCKATIIIAFIQQTLWEITTSTLCVHNMVQAHAHCCKLEKTQTSKLY